jgi:hypothetical protein
MTEPKDLDDLDVETPEADAVEQALDAEPSDEDDSGGAGAVSDDIEAPEWDVQEQSIPVPLDDDYP